MPTVPRYQRQVAPQPLPSGALRAVDTPTSAGVGAAQARAQIGRGVQDIGSAVSGIGEKFLNIAYSAQIKERQEAKDYADQLAVLGASNKLANFERGLYAEGGALTIEGEAAFGLPEKVSADFDKTADEIEFGMTNPEQKLAFAKMRSQRGLSIALDVERHTTAQIRNFAVQELTASRTNNSDRAILKGGVGAFDQSADSMNEYANDARTIGKRLGLAPEAIEADIRKFRSDVHIGVINQLVANENMLAARVYFEEKTGRTIDGTALAPEQGGVQQEYGLRPDGTKKGEGFLGPLQLPNGGVATEYSIADSPKIKGPQYVTKDNPEGWGDYPTLVPTLTKAEVQQVLRSAASEGKIPLSETIKDKAEAHALKRIAEGKSPFAGEGEQSTPYPDLARVGEAPKGAAPQKRSEIEGDKLDGVTKLLKTGNTKKQAQELSDTIIAGGGTFTEQLARVRTMTDDAEVREETEHLIRVADGDKERQRQETQRERSKAISNLLDKNPNIHAIPPAIWKDMDDTEKLGWMNYSEHVANYGASSVKTSPQVLQDLYSFRSAAIAAYHAQGANAALWKKWLATDIVKEHINNLSRQDIEQFLAMQAGDRDGKETDPTIFATEAMINQIIEADGRSIGINPQRLKTKAEQARFDAFYNAARDQLSRDFPPTSGKKPTWDDVRHTVDQQTKLIGPVYGKPTATYRYQAPLLTHVTDISQIPADVVRRMTENYRKAGKPYPTAAMLVRDYNELQQMSKGQ